MIPNATDLLPDLGGPIADLLIQEAAEEVLGEPVDDAIESHLADALSAWGFSPGGAPDGELEYKQTASKPGDLKIKRQLAEVEAAGEAGWTVFGVDVRSAVDAELKIATAEIKLPRPGHDGGGAQLNLLDAEVEAAGLRLQSDRYRGSLVELDPVAVLRPGVFVSPGPFAARVGDLTVHGGVLPGPGSPDVFIGGVPAVRGWDGHVCPACTPNPHGPGLLASSQATVLINGRPAIRVGDWVTESVGLDPVTSGCTSVLVGGPPPPLDCTVVDHEQRGLVEYDLEAGLDLLHAIGKVKVGLDVSLEHGIDPHLSYEGDLSVFRPWAEVDAAINVPLAIDVDLPLIGRVQRDYLTVGGKAELEARVLTAGADGSLKPGRRGSRAAGAAWIRPGKNKVKVDADLQKASEPSLGDGATKGPQ